ncbi:MAG: hypothetical protein HYY91_04520 [Candidatus Omnitrophica bacterium]|nr:hypothetical protein [Candidatus Omnitrophota bacterium]
MAWLWVLPSVRAETSGETPGALRLAVHVHSTISTGSLEPARALEAAQEAGLDGVLFTDSALRRWEYGVWPWRSVFKRAVEQPSVFTFGLARYQAALARLAAATGLLVIPGVEAAPFYYWRRSPFDRRGGQIQAWHQHLLVFGAGEAAWLQQLPLRDFDPYHGNQGAAPYQHLIEFVKAHGGLVFWAHPQAAHREQYGSVEAFTDPYPHLLELTTGYDGFAMADMGTLAFAEPGAVWDRLLEEYRQGRRARPVWVLGELDWRSPTQRPIDEVVTVVMAERTPRGVLEAIRAGRMWVVFRTGRQAPVLHRFEVTMLDRQARITFSGHGGTGKAGAAQAFLIKNGQLLHVEDILTEEFDLEWTDEASESPGYYRAIFKGPAGLIYTNPIFVY